MAVSLERFSGLVSGIYAAALDPALREPALRGVVGALGGEGGALLIAEPRARQFQDTAFGIDAAAVASYDAYYGRLDPIPPVLGRTPAGSVLASHEIFDHDAHRCTEFHNDWGRRVGAGDGVVASLIRDGDAMGWLVCSAPLRDERFATAEKLRLMRLLVPHLQQALRVQMELGEAAHVRDRALDAFEHARHGMTWIAPGGRIVHANAVATAIFLAGEGLTLQADGCLRAALPREDAELQRLIGFAASGGDDGIRSGGSMAVSRPHGKRPLAAHVLPLSRDLDYGASMALVVVVDVEQGIEHRPELLRQLFGLTRAEAAIAVATLSSGTLQGVADELSVSLSTVRTHLQRVYEKTGAHRQADLARLVETIEGGLVRPGAENDRNQ